jgi:hypothetical protein
MEIKLNDVYKFRYHEEVRNKKAFDPYWCFDGQLIVKENKNGLYLEDTYWSSDSRKFTLEEALQDGILTFVCNLDDVIECREYNLQYYEDEDTFNLSYSPNAISVIFNRISSSSISFFSFNGLCGVTRSHTSSRKVNSDM